MKLPINMIERMENAADLIFERVIYYIIIRTKKYDFIVDLNKTIYLTVVSCIYLTKALKLNQIYYCMHILNIKKRIIIHYQYIIILCIY